MNEQACLNMMAAENWTLFNRDLARKIGKDEAISISFLLGIHTLNKSKKNLNQNNEFYITDNRIAWELCMSIQTWRKKIRTSLIKQGLIETTARTGNKLFYRLNFSTIIDMMTEEALTYNEYCETQGVVNPTNLPQSGKSNQSGVVNPTTIDNTNNKTKEYYLAGHTETSNLATDIFNLGTADFINEEDRVKMFDKLVNAYPVAKITKKTKAREIFVGMPYNRAKLAMDNAPKYIQATKPRFVLALHNYLESECFTEDYINSFATLEKNTTSTTNRKSKGDGTEHNFSGMY